MAIIIVPFSKVEQPFPIGEDVKYMPDSDDIYDKKILEDGYIKGDVVYYTFGNQSLVIRSGYWEGDNYTYVFYEIPRSNWNRLEEDIEEDVKSYTAYYE